MNELSDSARIHELEEELGKSRDLVRQMVRQHEDQAVLAHSLAMANAESAELMAEIELKNIQLHETNVALARANAHAAELMATIVLKDEVIAESENKLKVTLSQLPALVWTVDKDLVCNSIYGALLGQESSKTFFRCSTDGIIGMRGVKLLLPRRAAADRQQGRVRRDQHRAGCHQPEERREEQADG